MNPVEPPVSVIRRNSEGFLDITWRDGHFAAYSLYDLRCACACAGCVHELTGQPLLDPQSVARDIAAIELSLAGNYALRIAWSDGHDSGLYTWERLRSLCPCGACG
jgi:ATP-binding protein involved in chromosome partitioning